MSYIAAPDPHGFNASPAGSHTEGQRFGNGKRFRDLLDGPFYVFRRKKNINPGGVSNFALETMGLAEFAPVGRATTVRGRMHPVFQPPQVYVQGQGLFTNGVGGISAGTFALTPLIDPYNGQIG